MSRKQKRLRFTSDDHWCLRCGRFWRGRYTGKRLTKEDIFRLNELDPKVGDPSSGHCPDCRAAGADEYVAYLRQEHPELADVEIESIRSRMLQDDDGA